LLPRLWIEVLSALISRIRNHIPGIIIQAIIVPWWNVCLSGPLLVCCHQPLIENIRINISTDSWNWWCYFLSRRKYLAWRTKIDYLILNLSSRM
jgi:hypothetical protein